MDPDIDVISILRDAHGMTPELYMTGDGRLFTDRAEADQHQRTLFINHHDRLAQQAQARAAQGVHL